MSILLLWLENTIWTLLSGLIYTKTGKGYDGEPLGDYAWKLLSLIKAKREKLVITDILINELKIRYSIAEINGLVILFEKFIIKIVSTVRQRSEAEKIAKERKIPSGDVLHAILARDYCLTLIARDNHFRRLKDIVNYYKPENLI